MVNYLDSRRIAGTTAERSSVPIPTTQGGWVELGRTTLGSAGDTITVSGLANKRYLMVLGNLIATGGAIGCWNRDNGDSGSNYADRYNDNGGTDATRTSATERIIGGAPAPVPSFNVSYTANYATKEKLYISHNVAQNTAGAANAPNRRETVGKWTNTSNAITQLSYNNDQAGSYDTGSEVVVLGWDPSDTHTTNFWQELYSGSGNAGMDTGVSGFTAKKYLWIQIYLEDMYSAGNVNMVLNGVESSNYATRGGINGTYYNYTLTSRSDNLIHSGQGNETNGFFNIFIVNDGSNEKLGISHSITQQTAGAANAPERQEVTFKDTQTTQITDIEVRRNTGSWGANSFLKVWGSD